MTQKIRRTIGIDTDVRTAMGFSETGRLSIICECVVLHMICVSIGFGIITRTFGSMVRPTDTVPKPR